MKFITSAKDLAQAADACVKAVAKKAEGPLGGILLKADGNNVQLSGYDLSTGVSTKVEAKVEETGATVFDKHIAEILKKLPDEIVTITVENDHAKIKSGNAHFSLIGMKAADYPELPDYAANETVSVPRETLLSMVRQTIFSVAVNENKVVHTGIKFEITSGEMKLIAVDGFRLAVRKETISYDGENREIIVPADALQNVTALLSKEKDENVTLYIGQKHIAFSTERYAVFSRLLEGEFLNYKSAIPKAFRTTVEVDTAKILASIERTAVIITDKIKSPLRCRIEPERIHFSVSTPLGSSQDSIPAEVNGNDLEIGFNNRFLMEALKAVETDEVLMQFDGPISPIIISPMRGDSFMYLILPVRLKAE